jgi:hypothetical protein
MDYCDQCRRHLNGALTCAGCGRAAEELRRTAPVPPAPTIIGAPEQHGIDADEHEEYAGASHGEEAPEPGGHRRPGRKPKSTPRRARSRRTRRIVVWSLGLVLAAGALSLAQLSLDPSGQSGGHGASVTDDGTSLDYDGDPSASGKPAVPGEPVSGPGAGDGGSASGSASPGPSASGDADGASGTAEDKAGSKGESDAPSDDAGSAGGGAGSGDSASGSEGPRPPAQTGPAAPPPTTTPSAPPTQGDPPADPQPTKTHCKPILVWCV